MVDAGHGAWIVGHDQRECHGSEHDERGQPEPHQTPVHHGQMHHGSLVHEPLVCPNSLARQGCPPVSLRGEDAGIEMRLPRTSWSPRIARRFVAARLNESLSGQDIVGAAALVTSELVTNAVQHTNATVRVRVERLADHVRVEVSDRSAPRADGTDQLALSTVAHRSSAASAIAGVSPRPTANAPCGAPSVLPRGQLTQRRSR
jgi:anti-sigma regulatory factor (Ser/Thr protein kinase)